jgi:hypothetical protein
MIRRNLRSLSARLSSFVPAMISTVQEWEIIEQRAARRDLRLNEEVEKVFSLKALLAAAPLEGVDLER